MENPQKNCRINENCAFFLDGLVQNWGTKIAIPSYGRWEIGKMKTKPGIFGDPSFRQIQSGCFSKLAKSCDLVLVPRCDSCGLVFGSSTPVWFFCGSLALNAAVWRRTVTTHQQTSNAPAPMMDYIQDWWPWFYPCSNLLFISMDMCWLSLVIHCYTSILSILSISKRFILFHAFVARNLSDGQ